MTESEDKEKGNLDVTINYIKFGQMLNNVIHVCQKLKNELDVLAIKKDEG